MNNPQPALDRPRCTLCGHLLTRSGECWFAPMHSQERTLSPVIAKPTLESETDMETMQLSLSDELFDRYEVEEVRLSVSGRADIPAEALKLIVPEGLEPGQSVAFTCRGHVRDVSAPYSAKDATHSGRLVLVMEVVEEVREL